MPTDVISKIGATNSPVTMDYTTLQSWEDACPADLTAVDQRWIGECYDQGEFVSSVAGTPVLVISGETVDSTRYIILRCATGASFQDKAAIRTTALAYNASNGVAIRHTASYTVVIDLQVDYTQFKGLQIKNDLGGADAAVRDYGSICTHGLMDSCIVVSPTGGSTILFASTVKNSLIIMTNAIGHAIRCSRSVSYYGCTLINTAVSTSYAIYNAGYNPTYTLKDVAIFGFNSIMGGAGSSTMAGDYNATDLASGLAGANSIYNLTFANQFVNNTSDFRAVPTGGLKAGTPDSTNIPTDISNTTRNATTPTIGAWELVTTTSGPFRFVGMKTPSTSIVLGI